MTTLAMIKDCLGKRVLVSCYDQPPQMTTVRALSPQEQFVWLSAAIPGYDQEIGWRHVARVEVLEVLGSGDMSMLQLDQSLQQSAAALAKATLTAATATATAPVVAAPVVATLTTASSG